MKDTTTPLERERLKYVSPLPPLLREICSLEAIEKPCAREKDAALLPLFPHTFDQQMRHFVVGKRRKRGVPLRVGVVLSGGQAAGGHNVIAALYDGIRTLHFESLLIGFLNGPGGILEGKFQEITESMVESSRNTGGFDLIGSGRTKIESEEQLELALTQVTRLKLDGLVIIGGDDSNTNAAILAEYFAAKKCSTCVVGVPKTIDGDLRSEEIEISFGFDTACKTYAELIGNIAKDARSAKKYTHFIKLMGRSASHIALECALKTHPNLTLIGEEIAFTNKSLQALTTEMTDLICMRAKEGKNYGVILIPEGVIEFIPDVKRLLKEINHLLLKAPPQATVEGLSREAKATFSFLPPKVQQQLLMDRDPHGNVQVSHIATEELLIHLVKEQLKKRKDYSGAFSPVSHFFGYEGRAAFPSNFDAHYCTSLGLTAALLIASGCSGYMSVITHLSRPVEEWVPLGLPLVSLMHLEMRKGKEKPVIQKAFVDLQGKAFSFFASQREKWKTEDAYLSPGPIQWFGSDALCNEPPFTLGLNSVVRI